jgi:hypothetical protein
MLGLMLGEISNPFPISAPQRVDAAGVQLSFAW